jgi:hypothetical protein
MEFDLLSRSVVGCAIEVHRQLGPGLLESTYRQCLAYELSHAAIPIRLAKVPVALLINFNVMKLQNGIKRFVL